MKKVILSFGAAVLFVLFSPLCMAEEITSADTPPAPDQSQDFSEVQDSPANVVSVQDYQTLDLTVCDSEGTPVPGARVTVRISDTDGGTGTTDETGRIRLSQLVSRLTYDLVISQDDCGAASASYQPSSTAREGDPDLLTVRLPQKAPEGLYTPAVQESRGSGWLIMAIASTVFLAADAVTALLSFLLKKKKAGKYEIKEEKRP